MQPRTLTVAQHERGDQGVSEHFFYDSVSGVMMEKMVNMENTLECGWA